MNDIKDLDLIDDCLETEDIVRIIQESQCSNSKCDQNKTFFHKLCLNEKFNGDKKLFVPQCAESLIYMLINILVYKPNSINDNLRDMVTNYYKQNNIKVEGLMSINYLNLLNETKYPTTTWLKYESLVSHLIKEQIYEPKRVANELLTIVKDELPQSVATKFASVLESIVKYCREANKDKQDEEEEEKWCEIIDWLSWFIGSSSD